MLMVYYSDNCLSFFFSVYTGSTFRLLQTPHESWNIDHVDKLQNLYCMFLLVIFRCECYDYLFNIAVEMKLHGLDPTSIPL